MGSVFERSGGEGLLNLGFKGLTGGGGIGVAACRKVVFNDVLLGAEKTFGAGGFEVPCGGDFLVRRDADFAALVGETTDNQFAGWCAGFAVGGFNGAVHNITVKGKVLASGGCGDLF